MHLIKEVLMAKRLYSCTTRVKDMPSALVPSGTPGSVVSTLSV